MGDLMRGQTVLASSAPRVDEIRNSEGRVAPRGLLLQSHGLYTDKTFLSKIRLERYIYTRTLTWSRFPMPFIGLGLMIILDHSSLIFPADKLDIPQAGRFSRSC